MRYFRDVDKREVDFVVLENNKPRQFVECKLRQRDIHPALRYLKRRFPAVYTVQIALSGEEDYMNKDGIHICPAQKYLAHLI